MQVEKIFTRVYTYTVSARLQLFTAWKVQSSQKKCSNYLGSYKFFVTFDKLRRVFIEIPINCIVFYIIKLHMQVQHT